VLGEYFSRRRVGRVNSFAIRTECQAVSDVDVGDFRDKFVAPKPQICGTLWIAVVGREIMIIGADPKPVATSGRYRA